MLIMKQVKLDNKFQIFDLNLILSNHFSMLQTLGQNLCSEQIEMRTIFA